MVLGDGLVDLDFLSLNTLRLTFRFCSCLAFFVFLGVLLLPSAPQPPCDRPWHVACDALLMWPHVQAPVVARFL